MTVNEFKQYIGTLYLGNWVVDMQKGVYRDEPVTNSKGDIITYKHVVACPIPILPTATLENVDTHSEKVEITFYKHKKLRSLVVERERIASNQKIVGLANDGVEISTGTAKNLVEFFADIIAQNQDRIPYKLSRAYLGWHEKNFIPYTGDLTFDGDDQFRSLFKSIAST